MAPGSVGAGEELLQGNLSAAPRRRSRRVEPETLARLLELLNDPAAPVAAGALEVGDRVWVLRCRTARSGIK